MIESNIPMQKWRDWIKKKLTQITEKNMHKIKLEKEKEKEKNKQKTNNNHTSKKNEKQIQNTNKKVDNKK